MWGQNNWKDEVTVNSDVESCEWRRSGVKGTLEFDLDIPRMRYLLEIHLEMQSGVGRVTAPKMPTS